MWGGLAAGGKGGCCGCEGVAGGGEGGGGEGLGGVEAGGEGVEKHVVVKVGYVGFVMVGVVNPLEWSQHVLVRSTPSCTHK